MQSEGPRLVRCLSVSNTVTVTTIQVKSTNEADQRVSPARIAY
jgi:hypothetical protein